MKSVLVWDILLVKDCEKRVITVEKVAMIMTTSSNKLGTAMISH